MIGIFIQLLISWALLWLFEKQDLSVLGLRAAKARLASLFFGFFAGAACCSLYFLLITKLTGNYWRLNPGFGGDDFASSSWWVFRSIIFEELLFRGALLYILIKRAGVRTGCIVSAVTFGIYHWFSYNVLGNPMSMVYVFILTAIWGLMYAWAFAKTGSLYLPVGLHFGWNLFNIVVFSEGPLKEQLLLSSNNGQKLGGPASIAMFLFQVFALPLLVYLYLKKYAKPDVTAV